MAKKLKILLVFLLSHHALTSTSIMAKASKSFELNNKLAKEHLEFLTSAPHPFGSDRQKTISKHIVNQLKKTNQKIILQNFSSETPKYPLPNLDGPVSLSTTKHGINIYSFPQMGKKIKSKNHCVIAIATHYDTKKILKMNYLGANDSGSSTVALIQILNYLTKSPTPPASSPTKHCSIIGIFFDGEEAVLPNWSDGIQLHPAKIKDNTYGSRHAASKLVKCNKQGKSWCLSGKLPAVYLKALILMDMIGSKDIKFSVDSNSHPRLLQLLRKHLKQEKLLSRLSKQASPIEDDHIPFVKKQIPALNIIDFNNLKYWHKHGDTSKNISYSSINIAAKAALSIAQELALEL